jgi:hypothetical protein
MKNNLFMKCIYLNLGLWTLMLFANVQVANAGEPYNGPHNVPGIVEAEDFDEGGPDVAYYDNEPGYASGATPAYRTDTDVEVVPNNLSDPDKGYHVGYTNAGEWLNYTVNVTQAGQYDFIFTWADPRDGKLLTVEVDGSPIAIDYLLPVTQDFDTYTTFTVADLVDLTEGEHVITVHLEHGNFDKFRIAAHVYAGIPYEGPHNVPGTIEAEHFDVGGEGVAYHDNEPTAQSGSNPAYRTDEGVEIEAGPIDGYHVGWTNAGEWLNYTVTVTQKGKYDFNFFWATTHSDEPLTVEVDGEAIATDATIPNTGSFSVYQKFTVAESIDLAEGEHLITVRLKQGNFDKFEIVPHPYAGIPYNGPHNVPGIIEAEDFDEGGDGVAYHDNEPGYQSGAAEPAYRIDTDVEIVAGPDEGYHVGNTNAGEWLRYTVNVTQTGKYDFIFTWADPREGKLLTVEVDGEAIATGYEIPVTADFDTYYAFTLAESIDLTEGEHVVTVRLEHGNFDKFEIKTSATGIKNSTSLTGFVYADSKAIYVKNYPAGTDISVYSLLGVKIAAGSAARIEVPAAGVYIVKIQLGNEELNRKVVVK